jgi:hypothetical protein
MPIAAVTGLPMLQEIGPTRFALAIQLVASVLLALILDRLIERFPMTGVRRYAALTGLTLVVLVPLLPRGLIHSTPAPTPAYFAGPAVDEIPDGSTLLPYPFPFYSGNTAMLWQTSSNMRFRMTGGEIYVPGPTGRSVNYPHGDLPQALWNVLVVGGPKRSTHWKPPSSTQRAALVSDLRAYVPTHGIGSIVVSTDGSQGRWVSSLATSAFGAPTAVHGAVSVWLQPGGPATG